MTTDKQARLKELRAKLKSLTPEQKQSLINHGVIATIEGRQLSLHNTLLCYIQTTGSNLPTVVGGFKQWLAAGRVVKRGQHGLSIWFPMGKHSEDEADEIHFYTTTVFDISQTEELTQGSKPTTPTPTTPTATTPTLAVMPEQPKVNNQVNEPEIMKGWTLV